MAQMHRSERLRAELIASAGSMDLPSYTAKRTMACVHHPTSITQRRITMDINELAKRVQALEDIEAIKQLKAEYADACDDM